MQKSYDFLFLILLVKIKFVQTISVIFDLEAIVFIIKNEMFKKIPKHRRLSTIKLGARFWVQCNFDLLKV